MARTQGSHAETTGPRVREAALTLFAQHGYAAVSMRQIATKVGVQAGALYNYTPDKQSLLFSLLTGHMEALLQVWDAQAQPATPEAQLEAFVRFHIRFHAARPKEVFISYMELRNLTPENFAVVEDQRRSYESRLEAILTALPNSDQTDPKIATWAIIAMLTGVNTWFRDSGRLTLAEVEDIYWDMVRKAVGLTG